MKVLFNSEQDSCSILSKFSSNMAKKLDPDFFLSNLEENVRLLNKNIFKAELEARKSQGEPNLTIKYKNNIPSIVKSSKNE